jgi:hypothetical protein
MPIRNIIACVEFIAKENGNRIASDMVELMPGKAPRMMPRPVLTKTSAMA